MADFNKEYMDNYMNQYMKNYTGNMSGGGAGWTHGFTTPGGPNINFNGLDATPNINLQTKEYKPGARSNNKYNKGINSPSLKSGDLLEATQPATGPMVTVWNKGMREGCRESLPENMRNDICTDGSVGTVSTREQSLNQKYMRVLFNNPSNFEDNKKLGVGKDRLLSDKTDPNSEAYKFFEFLNRCGLKFSTTYGSSSPPNIPDHINAPSILLVIGALHNLGVMANQDDSTGDITLETINEFKDNFESRFFDDDVSRVDKDKLMNIMDNDAFKWISWMMEYVNINKDIFKKLRDKSLFFTPAYRHKNVRYDWRNLLNNINNQYYQLYSPILSLIKAFYQTQGGPNSRATTSFRLGPFAGGNYEDLSFEQIVNDALPEQEYVAKLIGGGLTKEMLEPEAIDRQYQDLLDLINNGLKLKNKTINATDLQQLNRYRSNIFNDLKELKSVHDDLLIYFNTTDNNKETIKIDRIKKQINNFNTTSKNITQNRNILTLAIQQLINSVMGQ